MHLDSFIYMRTQTEDTRAQNNSVNVYIMQNSHSDYVGLFIRAYDHSDIFYIPTDICNALYF